MAARTSAFCLQAVTMKRAVGASTEERACAVNTIAHEWTHTIPNPQKTMDSLFQDGGHTGADKPLVSYTVGALAQCLYLTKHEYPMDSEQLKTCVRRVGTITFIRNSCEKGWAKKLLEDMSRSTQP